MRAADFAGCGLAGTNQTEASRHEHGRPIALGHLPGGIVSAALAINPAGVIVGGSYTASGEFHAF